jgi:hypothetical protein
VIHGRTDKHLEPMRPCERAIANEIAQKASSHQSDGVRIQLESRAATPRHWHRSSMSSRRSALATASASELLVQALQTSTHATSFKHVSRVHALLPADLFAAAPHRELAAAQALLLPRHQATVLMCAQLARTSLRHAKKLLPALVRVLALVPLGDTRNVYSTQVTQGNKRKRKKKKKEKKK